LGDPFVPPENPPESWNIPDEARHWYKGSKDGVAIFNWPEVPDGRAFILDLSRFAIWRQWRPDADEGFLRLRVSPYSVPEAHALARDNPDLLRTEERTRVEDRARELLAQVLVHARTRFVIEVEDPQAVKVIQLASAD
jgi:hypothetical protein